MKLNALRSQLQNAIEAYRNATQSTTDEADKSDYEDVAFLAEKLVTEIDVGRIDEAKRTTLAFSRRVADGYATQPEEYKLMSEIIGKIRDRT